MKKFIQTYGSTVFYLTAIVVISYFDTANAFNAAAPIKAKTKELLPQLEIVGACLATLSLVGTLFMFATGNRGNAIKCAGSLTFVGIVLAKVESIVTFMGFKF